MDDGDATFHLTDGVVVDPGEEPSSFLVGFSRRLLL